MANMMNGWNEWSKFVLKELERLNKNYDELDSKTDELLLEFRVFKKEMNIKSGTWGFIAGMIPAIGGILLLIFRGLL